VIFSSFCWDFCVVVGLVVEHIDKFDDDGCYDYFALCWYSHRSKRAKRLQYLIKLSINYKITRCYKYVYKKYEVVVLPREQMCHVKLRIMNEVKIKESFSVGTNLESSVSQVYIAKFTARSHLQTKNHSSS
jgi:hypothetical protein